MNIIARETGVIAYVEGTGIRISGDEQSVILAETVINKLASIVKAGEPLDKSRIIYCIELAKEGNTEGIEKIMSGVLAITARGKQIKYKTVGQKKYVDAIKKNTVVFGVGPAGTGKTYLAVAMAVSAFKNKEVEKIQKSFNVGEMTAAERYEKVTSLWSRTNEELTKTMMRFWKHLSPFRIFPKWIRSLRK